MRIVRHATRLLLLLLLLPLALLCTSRPLPAWQADFHTARCLGPCCLITDGFFELSCGEYPRPIQPASPPPPAPGS